MAIRTLGYALKIKVSRVAETGIFVGLTCIITYILFVFALCLVYPMLPISLDCLFLIVPSVFFSIYKSNNEQRMYFWHHKIELLV